MKNLTSCIGIALLGMLTSCGDESEPPRVVPDQSPTAIAELSPMLDQKEVTVKFSVSDLGGVSQLSIPGQAPTFIIEATSEHKTKDLTVWIEGELANVLDRLQLSLFGSNQLKKGTIIVASGSLTFSPGAGEREGHEWYTLHVKKWQKFRVVPPDQAE